MTEHQREIVLGDTKLTAPPPGAEVKVFHHVLHDQSDDTRTLRVAVHATSHFLEIRAEGYGEPGAADGHGSPVLLEFWEGRFRVAVYPNINADTDPTVIDLEGARESLRKDDDGD